MRDDLPRNIDLNFDVPEDPTEFVTENKEFLLELKECGFDGRKIGKILRNYHGLRLSDIGKKDTKKGWHEFDDFIGPRLENDKKWPSRAKLKKYRAEHKKGCKSIDYAIRSAKGLMNNPYIPSETKESLENNIEHLLKVKERRSYKPYKNDRLLHPDEKNVKRPATSIAQMTGFQVLEIYHYIKPFNEIPEMARWKDMDIFSLICEIFNKVDSKNQSITLINPYTKEDIKSLYYNNLRYEDILV